MMSNYNDGEYIVIKYIDINKFIKSINAYTKRGFKPVGGLVLGRLLELGFGNHTYEYHQAMVYDPPYENISDEEPSRVVLSDEDILRLDAIQREEFDRWEYSRVPNCRTECWQIIRNKKIGTYDPEVIASFFVHKEGLIVFDKERKTAGFKALHAAMVK